jgi:hypothetical protein
MQQLRCESADMNSEAATVIQEVLLLHYSAKVLGRYDVAHQYVK